MGKVNGVGSTRAEAERLASNIQQFWAAQGRDVDVRIEKVTFSATESFVVRTDMVNGMPKGKTA